MCADNGRKKSTSPQASPESSSLQVNRMKNKEALEKGLRCRRSIKELVNQGILLSPSISHSDTVRQLQRAKTSDQLKHKIERRPDRQYLISRRIIRDDKPGTSPLILEQCHNLEKYQLKNSLNSKLTKRPGTLELVEKGVLQVDPGIDSLIRGGSISYPRVETPRSSLSPANKISSIAESDTDDVFVIPTPPSSSSHSHVPVNTSGVTSRNAAAATPPGRQRTPSTSRALVTSGATSSSNSTPGSGITRSMRGETVVYKMGSFVFHNYFPKSSSNSSASASSTPVTNLFQQKQIAREAQQAEMLRLQDTALAHRLIEQELCERIGCNALRQANSEEYEQFPQEPPLGTADNPGDSPFSACSLLSPSTHSSGTGGVSGPLSIMMVTSPDTEVTSELATSPSVLLSQTAVPTPRRQSGSETLSVVQKSPLERLNINQLRFECGQRGLARYCPKAQLVRQLEAYRDELTTKYQLPVIETSHVSDRRVSSQAGAIRPSTQRLTNTATETTGDAFPVPVSVPPGFLSLGPQSGVATTTPVTTVPYFALSPISVNENTVYLHPSLSSEIFPASSCTPVTPVTSSNCMAGRVGNPLFLHCASTPISYSCDPSALRHSASEPQFATAYNPHAIGASPASVQPTAGVSNLFFRPMAATHSGRSVSNSCYTPLSSSPSLSALTSSGVPAIKPTHSITQNVVCVTQLPGSQAYRLPGLCSNPVPSQPVPGSHRETGETPFVYQTGSTSVSYMGPLESPAPSTAVVTSNSLCRNAGNGVRAAGDRHLVPPGAGQSSSLNQIEAYWLRIRQLRRSLSKVNAFSDGSIEVGPTGTHFTDPSQLAREQALQLEQEHERLCVLCRLLVIDRLDALDELASNDQTKVNNNNGGGCGSGAGQCLLTSSDLHVERSVLDSYLRKLGGTSILQLPDNCSVHPPMTSAFANQPTWAPSTLTALPNPVRRLSDIPIHPSPETSHLFQINQQQQHQQHREARHRTSVGQSSLLCSSPPTTTTVLSQPTGHSVLAGWSPHGMMSPDGPASRQFALHPPGLENNGHGGTAPGVGETQSNRSARFACNGPLKNVDVRQQAHAAFELPSGSPSTPDGCLSPGATDMLFALWDGATSMEEGGTTDAVVDVLEAAPPLAPAGVSTPPLFEVDMDTQEVGQHIRYQHYRRGMDICAQAAARPALTSSGHVTSGAPSSFLLHSTNPSVGPTPTGHPVHFFTTSIKGENISPTSSSYNECKASGARKLINGHSPFPAAPPTDRVVNQTSWPVASYSAAEAVAAAAAASAGTCLSPTALALLDSTVSSGCTTSSSSSSAYHHHYQSSETETSSFFNSLDVSDFAELMDTIETGTVGPALPAATCASGPSHSLIPSGGAPVPLPAVVLP